MVGTSADDADAYPVALVPAGEAIDDVDAIAGVEEVDGTFTVDAPDLSSSLVKDTGLHVMNFQSERDASAVHADVRGSRAPARHVQGCGQHPSALGMRLACMTSTAEFHKLILRIDAGV